MNRILNSVAHCSINADIDHSLRKPHVSYFQIFCHKLQSMFQFSKAYPLFFFFSSFNKCFCVTLANALLLISRISIFFPTLLSFFLYSQVFNGSFNSSTTKPVFVAKTRTRASSANEMVFREGFKGFGGVEDFEGFDDFDESEHLEQLEGAEVILSSKIRLLG